MTKQYIFTIEMLNSGGGGCFKIDKKLLLLKVLRKKICQLINQFYTSALKYWFWGYWGNYDAVGLSRGPATGSCFFLCVVVCCVPASCTFTLCVIFPRFGFRTAVPDTKSSHLRAASLRALRCPGCLHPCQKISTIHRSAAQTDHIYWPCTDTWTVSTSSMCWCQQEECDTHTNYTSRMTLLHSNNVFFSIFSPGLSVIYLLHHTICNKVYLLKHCTDNKSFNLMSIS